MKFYLIHHAHTDIGYTDRQEKIAWNHARYLEQVVELLRDRTITGPEPFCWNVESFWMLESFLARGRQDAIADFWKFVKEGRIGLSLSYLNGTDLMDAGILRETLSACRELAARNGVTIENAMTADINGYSWGYVSILAEAGVKHLLSAVHTHHGYHVAWKKQFPFYWEGPDGKKVLVWQSEHYHLGNEINIHQLAGQYGYMIKDGLANTGLSNWELSKQRLFNYAAQLKQDGYPFDFCPILVSGLSTDNSPPGPAIARFVERWNRENGREIPMEMTTLDHFFAEVEAHSEGIPTYSGDWTDWWADGTCSTPASVSHYREAVRKYTACRELDPTYRLIPREKMDSARHDLMLYAEHTWGFSSSVSEPAHPMVNLLDMRKTLYAARANETVSECLDLITESYGETPMAIWKDYRLHAVNPTNHPLAATARIDLEILFTHRHFRLIREQTGEEVPYQLSRVARGFEFNIPVTLSPHEHASFRLEELPAPMPSTIGMTCNYGADEVRDFAFDRLRDPDWACTPFELITPFLHVKWEMGRGITSIFDRIQNRELVQTDQDPETAFEPVYEITPIRTDPCTERRRMGRNRKAMHTRRDFGRLTDVRVTDFGPVFSRVILTYSLEGCQSTELILTAYRSIPKLDVDFRLHKDSRLEPENVYLSLPFARNDAVLYADKTGCVFRPRIDQLPGSCCDYYALQNGICWVGSDSTLLIEMRDAPMISMGTLLPHDIRLAGDPLVQNTDRVYAWVMNNFWETNFKVSLGGFYTFHYSLKLLKETDPRNVLAEAAADNTDVLAFFSFDRPLDD